MERITDSIVPKIVIKALPNTEGREEHEHDDRIM